MPAAYARTATEALTNVTYRYVELLANHGVPGAFSHDAHLIGGLNTFEGHVTHPAVAKSHGLPFVEASNLLSAVA
jgi:alanine dehydrogenase